LIVQDALLSLETAKSSLILNSILGIIFLGTPFFTQETEWAKFGKSITETTKATQLPDPSRLAQLRLVSGEFIGKWLKTLTGTRISIWCFFESLPLYRIGIVSITSFELYVAQKKVAKSHKLQLVPRVSATIDLKKSSPLQADHFTISKSDGPWDSRYQSICATLRLMCYKGREISRIERIECPDNREIVIQAIENKHSSVALKYALALEDQGHLANAETHYRKIIENRKFMNKYEDQVVLFCQDKLASISRDRGSYGEAESLYEMVLERKIKLLGRSHILTLQSAANLALVLMDQGYYKRALDIICDNLGSKSQNFYQKISRVRLVSILAAIFRDLGIWTLSLLLSRNVLSACEVLLGPHDPFTLDQASNLALVLSGMRKYRFAEMIDRRVLDTLEKNLGTNHPKSLNVTTRLANHLRFQKRYECAVELLTRTLKVQETQLGSSHPDTLSTKCGLATTYALQGRISDSKILVLQVNDRYMTILNKGHPNRLWTANTLKYLQMINTSSSQVSASESGTSDLSSNLYQTVKNHSGHPNRLWAKNALDSLEMVNPSSSQDSTSESGTLDLSGNLYQTVKNRSDTKGLGFLAKINLRVQIRSLCGTLLHKACFDENESMIDQLLMQSNVDINAQVGLFGTPLCVASFTGHTSMVKKLLNAGASPDAKGTSVSSALRVALMMNHQNVLRTLLEKKASPNIEDRWHGTPLHEASMAGQSDTVNLLLEFAAKPNVRGGIFGSALLASAWEGNLINVKSLLREGAFLDAQEDGKTALYLAQVEGHADIVTTLYQAAARRATDAVGQSDPEAALGQIDVESRPGNLAETRNVATSAPSVGDGDATGEPSLSKDLQKVRNVEVDPTGRLAAAVGVGALDHDKISSRKRLKRFGRRVGRMLRFAGQL
jgi:ankyrin repeat protein